MKIRVLTNIDADLFRKIRLEAIEDSPESFGESLEEASRKSTQDFERSLSDHGKGDFVLGGFVDEELVGTVGVYREALFKLAHKANLWGLYVKPANRGKGHGSSLVARAVEIAKSHADIKQINLIVVASNKSAITVYKRLGFAIYGTEPDAICVAGTCHDEHHMKLVL
jgi:RimJ/RimL family protein N-acetyltransferase